MPIKQTHGTVRVLIADDQPIFRKGLIELLRKTYSHLLFTEAITGFEALNLMQKGKFDLLLLRIELPRINGYEVMKEMKLRKIEVPVIMLSQHTEAGCIIRAYNEGAGAYVAKDCDHQLLYEVICRVLLDGIYMSPATQRLMAEEAQSIHHPKPTEEQAAVVFSKEQLAIIHWAAKELTYEEVGKKVNKGTRTVEEWAGKMIHQVGCKKFKGVILYAIKTGQLQQEDAEQHT